MKRPIYLDHAATTPLDAEVLKAMRPYLTEKFYNPSALYTAARDIKKDIEAARGRVAHWLGARPGEIIFTAGGTEANNLAMHGVMSRVLDAHVLVSAVEHDSVLEAADRWKRHIVPVGPDGLVDVAVLEKSIDDSTALVSIMYANNEVGTIQPIRRISQLVADVNKARQAAGNDLKLLLHTDACQAGPYLDLHTARLGVDMMTLNGSKIYGPKQTGVLYVRAGIELDPLVRGGGQERDLRSGTENVAGIIGFAAALDKAQTMRGEETHRLQELQLLFYRLLRERIPAARINGTRKSRLPNNVHITIPGQDNERLMMLLDERGVMAAVGSACSASSDEPSHVLSAMGLIDDEARASLRFTMGRSTDEAAIRYTVDTLAEVVA